MSLKCIKTDTSAKDYIEIENYKAIIENILGKISNDSWKWYDLSRSKHFSIDILRQFPKGGWDPSIVSSHPNITWKDIKSYSKFFWYHTEICHNPNITWETVKDDPTFLHKYGKTTLTEEMFKNRKEYIRWKDDSKVFTIEDVKKYPKYEWNWYTIAEKKELDWENIKSRIGGLVKEWNWNAISRNPNVTLEIIRNDPKYEWNLAVFAGGPNGTLEIVKNNPDLFKEDHVYHVHRIGDEFEARKFKEWNSARKIQRWFRDL